MIRSLALKLPLIAALSLGLALGLCAVTLPGEAQAQGILKRFQRDVEAARKDFRRKMGVDVRVERRRPGAGRQAQLPRGGVITRDSGLVATSIRPEPRPGEAVARAEGPSAAEARLETLLAEHVAAGDLAPEIAQVIRAGTFPTRAELEARAAALGNGWLPGGARMALRGARVICEEGSSGGCDRVAEDPALSDLRQEAEVIEAQAEALRIVAGLPRLAAAMAEVARERDSRATAQEAAAVRAYPVARGEELPPIDSLLDTQGN